MRYPRYTREENLSCKLSDDDIKEIRRRRQDGESCRTIAEDFPVSIGTVWNWGLDEKSRIEILEKRSEYPRKPHRLRHIECVNRYLKRKKELYPELFVEYEKQKNKRRRKEMGKEVVMF